MSCMNTVREAFLKPHDEFSPMPFWFWNDELTNEEIRRQIHDFYDHGVAGFVIHPRKGMPRTIPYMSEKYMDFVRFAVKEAESLGMEVILYDEAMYPSGSAHGMVVRENPAWASRCLVMDVSDQDVPEDEELIAVCSALVQDGKASEIRLEEAVDGVYAAPGEGRSLLCFRVCFSGGTIRGIHEEEDDGERFAPASADLLNPQAVQAFIRLTHERYYEALSESFGRTIIAVFTDEPDITGRRARKGSIAWTDGFLQEFGRACELPALFLNVGQETDAIRLRYRRAVNNRMLETYYGPLADWCEKHHVALTGHPAKSWDIGLLKPFQLPGQDVVWRFVGPGNGIDGADSVLAKCAADAARHAGRRRNLNECFGCCGPDDLQWAFSADDMKWYMDYLFVRGTNLLCPHAFFYSVRDGRGDERPPDVGPNNLWWPMYGEVAMYMRRLSWLMTDSVNQARVAVLCEADRMPWESCKALYENQIEFNYLELSRVPDCALVDGALCIEKQRYTHVLSGKADLSALPRDLVITPAAPDLRVSHVVKSGKDFYLLVNEGEETISGRVRVAAQGGAEWWNAWTGEMKDAFADEEGGYALVLPRRESIILCIDPEKEVCHGSAPAADQHEWNPLRGCEWQVIRMDDGVSLAVKADENGCLPGFETIEGWEAYSGWVAYETELDVPEAAALNLGEAHELVRILINGQEIAHKMWSPFAFALSGGRISLRVEVCNTLCNRLEGKALPSGLMGPVCIG
ncbi:MAG: hypothetical protein IKK75_00460 [Clostridia bacterium]|nr:hypothetical protein [Clostridia bacterium]